MRRSIAAAAMAGSLLTGAAVGSIALAPTPIGAQEAAAEVPPGGGRGPLSWVRGALAELVGDGTIDQGQADAVEAALAEARPPRHPVLRHLTSGAAEVIGITPQQLRTELVAGRSLAQVAEAHGMAKDDLVQKLLAAHEAHLAKRVAAGDLTQEQADARIAAARERLPEAVDRTRPEGSVERAPRGPGSHHRRGELRPAPEPASGAPAGTAA